MKLFCLLCFGMLLFNCKFLMMMMMMMRRRRRRRIRRWRRIRMGVMVKRRRRMVIMTMKRRMRNENKNEEEKWGMMLMRVRTKRMGEVLMEAKSKNWRNIRLRMLTMTSIIILIVKRIIQLGEWGRGNAMQYQIITGQQNWDF